MMTSSHVDQAEYPGDKTTLENNQNKHNSISNDDDEKAILIKNQNEPNLIPAESDDANATQLNKESRPNPIEPDDGKASGYWESLFSGDLCCKLWFTVPRSASRKLLIRLTGLLRSAVVDQRDDVNAHIPQDVLRGIAGHNRDKVCIANHKAFWPHPPTLLHLFRDLKIYGGAQCMGNMVVQNSSQLHWGVNLAAGVKAESSNCAGSDFMNFCPECSDGLFCGADGEVLKGIFDRARKEYWSRRKVRNWKKKSICWGYHGCGCIRPKALGLAETDTKTLITNNELSNQSDKTTSETSTRIEISSKLNGEKTNRTCTDAVLGSGKLGWGRAFDWAETFKRYEVNLCFDKWNDLLWLPRNETSRPNSLLSCLEDDMFVVSTDHNEINRENKKTNEDTIFKNYLHKGCYGTRKPWEQDPDATCIRIVRGASPQILAKSEVCVNVDNAQPAVTKDASVAENSDSKAPSSPSVTQDKEKDEGISQDRDKAGGEDYVATVEFQRMWPVFLRVSRESRIPLNLSEGDEGEILFLGCVLEVFHMRLKTQNDVNTCLNAIADAVKADTASGSKKQLIISGDSEHKQMEPPEVKPGLSPDIRSNSHSKCQINKGKHVDLGIGSEIETDTVTESNPDFSRGVGTSTHNSALNDPDGSRETQVRSRLPTILFEPAPSLVRSKRVKRGGSITGETDVPKSGAEEVACEHASHHLVLAFPGMGKQEILSRLTTASDQKIQIENDVNAVQKCGAPSEALAGVLQPPCAPLSRSSRGENEIAADGGTICHDKGEKMNQVGKGSGGDELLPRRRTRGELQRPADAVTSGHDTFRKLNASTPTFGERGRGDEEAEPPKPPPLKQADLAGSTAAGTSTSRGFRVSSGHSSSMYIPPTHESFREVRRPRHLPCVDGQTRRGSEPWNPVEKHIPSEGQRFPWKSTNSNVNSCPMRSYANYGGVFGVPWCPYSMPIFNTPDLAPKAPQDPYANIGESTPSSILLRWGGADETGSATSVVLTPPNALQSLMKEESGVPCSEVTRRDQIDQTNASMTQNGTDSSVCGSVTMSATTGGDVQSSTSLAIANAGEFSAAHKGCATLGLDRHVQHGQAVLPCDTTSTSPSLNSAGSSELPVSKSDVNQTRKCSRREATGLSKASVHRLLTGKLSPEELLVEDSSHSHSEYLSYLKERLEAVIGGVWCWRSDSVSDFAASNHDKPFSPCVVQEVIRNGFTPYILMHYASTTSAEKALLPLDMSVSGRRNIPFLGFSDELVSAFCSGIGHGMMYYSAVPGSVFPIHCEQGGLGAFNFIVGALATYTKQLQPCSGTGDANKGRARPPSVKGRNSFS